MTLSGWVARRRDHGGLIFVDLRDRTGLVQVVIDPADAPDAHAVAHDLRVEAVVRVVGDVVARSPETVNPRLETGEVEVAARELECSGPPTRCRSSSRTRTWTRRSASATARSTCAGP